jgi:hypothetical protein
MAHGGARPGAGRKKQERPLDGNVARKIKAKIRAEEKWARVAELAYVKAIETGHTGDIVRILIYLDNRDLGNTVDTVNHLHDQPLEVNMTVSLAETIQKARKRAAEKHK